MLAINLTFPNGMEPLTPGEQVPVRAHLRSDQEWKIRRAQLVLCWAAEYEDKKEPHEVLAVPLAPPGATMPPSADIGVTFEVPAYPRSFAGEAFTVRWYFLTDIETDSGFMLQEEFELRIGRALSP